MPKINGGKVKPFPYWLDMAVSIDMRARHLLNIKVTYLRLLLIILFISASAKAQDACDDWFVVLKIKPNDANCEMKCAMGDTDMGSFDCPSRCDSLCHPKKPRCKLDSFWKGRLKGSAEPFKSVDGSEQLLLEQALSRIPTSFRPASLKAIVKGTKPVDFTAPSTEATSTDEFVILYPKAFSNPKDLDRIVAHEIVHVLVLGEWAQSFELYKVASGWASAKNNGYREGEFVEQDGKTSPDEDFANNVEYFLFNPSALKVKSRKIFSWLRQNLGKKLRLEKGCAYEN